jgi:hypothetical protein
MKEGIKKRKIDQITIHNVKKVKLNFKPNSSGLLVLKNCLFVKKGFVKTQIKGGSKNSFYVNFGLPF